MLTGALLWLTLLVGAVAYGQGLGGWFFLDDYQNLDDLSEIGAEPGLPAAARFVLSGIAGPLGRPLSLATFAAQYASWPHAPGDFIYVNIALHLLNACLLFWGLRRILDLAPAARTLPRAAVALAVTWLWLFASLQTGAVLYVIQRMTELAGTCSLLGLLLYTRGRELELAGRPVAGVIALGAGLFTGTILGVLAKESAAVFPLLILALEHTLWRDLPRSRLFRALQAAFVWMPSALLLGYLAYRMPPLSGLLPDRSFSLGERLLTEPGVLFMYLRKLLLPPLYGLRLYYDDYPAAQGLTPAVLAAIAAWLALIIAAIRLRTVATAFSFAVAWFLAAHLLESTVIPLELAFDHRNYLAALGPLLALAWGAAWLLARPELPRARPVFLVAALAYALYTAVAASQAATLWGRPRELINYWSVSQPESRRAQRGAAKFYWDIRRPDLSLEVYEKALQRWPGDISFLLAIYELGCFVPDMDMPPLTRIEEVADRYDSTIPGSVSGLHTLVTLSESGVCKRYSPSELWSMVQMVFKTPALDSQRQNRLFMEGRIAALANDEPVARERFDEALSLKIQPLGLYQALVFAVDAGDTACADRYLERFDQLSPLDRWPYEKDLEALRARRAAPFAQAPRTIRCTA